MPCAFRLLEDKGSFMLLVCPLNKVEGALGFSIFGAQWLSGLYAFGVYFL